MRRRRAIAGCHSEGVTGIRTTVTLDEDVLERLKRRSRATGAPFRQTLNDLPRAALLHLETQPRPPTLGIRPVQMGYEAGLNHDDVESLLECGEGGQHRSLFLAPRLPVYACNADAPQQPAAARWLKELFESGETAALPWMTLRAFVRISTNSRIWTNPWPAKDAFALIREWLSRPGVVVLQPGPRHSEILELLVVNHNTTGPLVTDAVLAALAMENGAVLASTDQDFRRFPDLRRVDPLGRQAGARP